MIFYDFGQGGTPFGATNIDSQGGVPGGGSGEPTPEPPRTRMPVQLAPAASLAVSPQRLPAAVAPTTTTLPAQILTKPQKVDQIMTAPTMPTPPTDRVDMELGPAPAPPTMPSTAPVSALAPTPTTKKSRWWWLLVAAGGVAVVGTGVALATRKPRRFRKRG